MNSAILNQEIQSYWVNDWVKNGPINVFYAQTNIQLFNQLRFAGYSDADISYMCDIYDFALEIFAGRFRGSGKPFISHLVGTAGILASLQASMNVVAAGLLHAAFIYGEYGTDQRRVSNPRLKHGGFSPNSHLAGSKIESDFQAHLPMPQVKKSH